MYRNSWNDFFAVLQQCRPKPQFADIASQKVQLLMEDSDGVADSDMSSSTTDELATDNHSVDDGVYPLPDSASDTSDLQVISNMATVGNAAWKAGELPLDRKTQNDAGRTVPSLNRAAANVSDVIFSVPGKTTHNKKFDAVTSEALHGKVSVMSCKDEDIKETVIADMEDTRSDMSLTSKRDRTPVLLGCDNGTGNHSKTDAKNELFTQLTEKCSVAVSEARSELAMQNSERFAKTRELSNSSCVINGQRQSAVESLKSRNVMGMQSDSRDSNEDNNEDLQLLRPAQVNDCFIRTIT